MVYSVLIQLERILPDLGEILLCSVGAGYVMEYVCCGRGRN